MQEAIEDIDNTTGTIRSWKSRGKLNAGLQDVLKFDKGFIIVSTHNFNKPLGVFFRVAKIHST